MIFIRHKKCQTELEWRFIRDVDSTWIRAPYCIKCNKEVSIQDMDPQPTGSVTAWPIKDYTL
jgi:hypothetical protein